MKRVIDSIPISPVWSGHPVRFDLVTHKDHQFVAFYDADRKMTIGARKLDQDTFDLVRPQGKWLEKRSRLSTDIEWDSHNAVTIAIDRDDHIHLSGNMHVDPLVYFRTTNPLDITSFERLDAMIGRNEERCTYPIFMRGPEGELVFRYRDGNSGNGVDYYNGYAESSRTWSRIVDVPILDGMDLMNAYARVPEIGPDNAYHMVWMWRDTGDCATNHDIAYASSRDLRTWTAGDGSPLELPITIESTASIVDPVPSGGGLLNMNQSLGFDTKGRPIVSYHKHDDNGNTQACCARFEEGAWRVRVLSDWDTRWDFGGGGSIAGEIRVGPAQPYSEGRLSMSWWRLNKGEGIWILDEATLEVVHDLPEPEPDLPEELRRSTMDYAGMTVRTAVAGIQDDEDDFYDDEPEHRVGDAEYVLRWETLTANRDRPRPEIPPPSELRLYILG